MYVIVRVKSPERHMHDGVKIRHRPGPLSDPKTCPKAGTEPEVVPVAG